ncbi:MAG TPA: hypothetical protein VMY77_06005 [Chitinophagaceae bacterium]|nr:hypothetical protein [Chitinophagaceae bacterium]
MGKSIKIFKSFEEQEQYHKEIMINTTPHERFKKLYQMQQVSKKFRPMADKSRKIIIHHSKEEKDTWDIERLEELRNAKK